MKIRYCQDWAKTKEVSVEKAQQLQTYGKIYIGENEKIIKMELIDSGKMFSVEYYLHALSPEQIRISHCKNYPDVPFTISRILQEVGDYQWSYIYSFSKASNLVGYSKSLSDNEERELMRIEIYENQKTAMITKYYWDRNDDIRYAFEYNSSTLPYAVYDLLYGDRASLSDLKDYLEDFAFYKHGYALPQAIADTEIPSTPQYLISYIKPLLEVKKS